MAETEKKESKFRTKLTGLKGKVKPGIKSAGKYITDTPKRVRTWFLGTEEKPVPIFGYRARIRRWYLVRFRNHVYLYTTYYDTESKEYQLEKTIKPRSKIPKDAVPVTNWKKSYHYDIDLPKRGFSTVDDSGFTAVSAWLYMKSNKFEEAMRVNLDMKAPLDMKKLIMVVAVVFGIFCGVYFYAMPA